MTAISPPQRAPGQPAARVDAFLRRAFGFTVNRCRPFERLAEDQDRLPVLQTGDRLGLVPPAPESLIPAAGDGSPR